MSAQMSHQTVRLARGRHQRPEHGVCVMELASMLAGEPFTDHPRSVCRVLAAVLRACNDRFDAETRQRLYRYAAEAVGTAGDARISDARVERCAAAQRQRAGRGRLGRWLRRSIVPPPEPLGPELEGFAADVVRSFPKTSEGARELMALVDELIAIGGPRPAAARLAAPREMATASAATPAGSPAACPTALPKRS